jgi:hypothetical protein
MLHLWKSGLTQRRELQFGFSQVSMSCDERAADTLGNWLLWTPLSIEPRAESLMPKEESKHASHHL